MLNPPLTFVIDTTKSVKPDKDSIFNLTKKVVDSIKIDSINIPRSVLQYLLTASLSADFRSQKGTKLLHTSGACPGDGSYYY